MLDAAADSAQKPSTGLSFVTLCPMVFTIRQPPHMTPRAIAPLQAITTHNGT